MNAEYFLAGMIAGLTVGTFLGIGLTMLWQYIQAARARVNQDESLLKELVGAHNHLIARVARLEAVAQNVGVMPREEAP